MDRSPRFYQAICRAMIGLSALTATLCLNTSHAQEGRATYEKTCAACHAKGVVGAPQSNDSPAWQLRLNKNGYSGLFDNAIKGKGAMPPKGGDAALSEDEVMSAVMHILRLATTGGSSPAVASTAKTAKPAEATSAKGRSVYQASCAACHATGAAGAPKLGDIATWAPRIASGTASLNTSALKGKGAMPAKGGNATLADADVKAAVEFMVAQSQGVTAAVVLKPEAKTIAAASATESVGNAVYQANCTACHATGLAGAPKTGDSVAWSARVKLGNASLYVSAIKGKGAMPPKGGNAALSDASIKGAVDFMVAQIGAATSTKASPSVKAADIPPAVQEVVKSPTSSASQTVIAIPQGTRGGDVNSFNRLMQAPGKRNLPPLEDGIHDVANDATGLLQAPLQAYAGLAKSNAGNRIDWVKALNDKKLLPRADKQDVKAEMAVLELNIVREVKGSMPDVVYPHRQHTQWLDCSNCHPAIFIPQKGANQMSMAAIILGQQCGVCHGKVAFPISECRLCHSKAKDPTTVSAGVKP